MKKAITIFTPTYNRAYCLGKCYKSLQQQKNKNFVWLIIDDGSTDDTNQLVKKWIQETTDFEIRYIYKKNGGMHTGYNTAYENIDTELCMNVDSDDYLTPTAISDILTFWNENKRKDVGGIYALDCFENGEVVGQPFPEELKEFHGWGCKRIYYTNAKGRKKYTKVYGDKKFIGVTDIINQYPPFPVFEGEKYYQLYHKQHLIERDYTILIYNKPVCVVEYMQDGSSKNMFNQYFNNPKGFAHARKYVMENAPWLMMRFVAAIHYVAESTIAQNKHFINEYPKKALVMFAFIPGKILYHYIMFNVRNKQGRMKI